MTYLEWFEAHWIGEDEGKTLAIFRLSGEANVNHLTIRKAMKGQRITPACAERLAAVTDGKVSPVDLVFVDAA